MGQWLWHWASSKKEKSSMFLFGNGKKKNPYISLQKWMKKLNTNKILSNLIITKMNLQQLEKTLLSFGCGMTMKKLLSYILQISPLRKLLLKLFSLKTLLKLSQVPKKVSSLSGISLLSWKISLNRKKGDASKLSTSWIIPIKLTKWKSFKIQTQQSMC